MSRFGIQKHRLDKIGDNPVVRGRGKSRKTVGQQNERKMVCIWKPNVTYLYCYQLIHIADPIRWKKHLVFVVFQVSKIMIDK